MSAQQSHPVRPGRGKHGKTRKTPKGRQVHPAAAAEVSELLQGRSLARDRLIENLHLIHDKYNCLSTAHLAALAAMMKLSQAEVHEVASFYHHFDIVREGETAPPAITIRVCDSLSCDMAGSAGLLRELAAKAPGTVRVITAPCMGLCDKAPAAAVGKNYQGGATTDTLLKRAENRQVTQPLPDFQSFADYAENGGYSIIKDLRAGDTSPDAVIETLNKAGLRGLGGAGFPSGQKWKFVRAEKGPRYVCINADEGEPGTFKDRHYLSSRPHQFLEGVLIAAWGVDAQKAYIYLRDEYPAARAVLAAQIAEIEHAGLIDAGFIELRRGAGAYICGEESAMIESIEGKRGLPRHRPPYVAQVGLFGRPTLVHNVETVYWMPEILKRGADWFAALGRDGHKGNRSYSVSGRIKNPGVVLTSAGASLNELIKACGGMADGHTLKAFLPGGASGGILPASMADVPLDFGTLEKYGSFVGSHAVIVLSDQDNMADVALNLMKFFKHESCGQCTPCRVGCEKAVALMGEKTWDKKLLAELAQVMADASICGLGQAAPNPLKSVLQQFSGQQT